jgi:hypothetical protein
MRSCGEMSHRQRRRAARGNTMTTRFRRLTRPALVVLALGVLPVATAAQTAQAQYTAAKTRDDAVRSALAAFPATTSAGERTKVITETRAVIAAYEAIVRRFRASGYADNALHNAATLAEALYGRFSLTTDLDAAIRLHKRLSAEYPTAALAKESTAATARLLPLAEARAAMPPATVAPGPVIADRSAAPSGETGTTTGHALSRSQRARLTAI